MVHHEMDTWTGSSWFKYKRFEELSPFTFSLPCWSSMNFSNKPPMVSSRHCLKVVGPHLPIVHSLI